jgi:hypothetical protein
MEWEKGVATTVQPAARPAAAPEDESSKTTQSCGTKPSNAAPARIGVDDALGHGNAAGCHAQAGEPLGGAGDHGPSIRGQRCQQWKHAGKHAKPLPVGEFDLLNELEFRGAVQIGTKKGDGLDGPTSMGGANRSLRVYAAHQRPFGPTALDGSH